MSTEEAIYINPYQNLDFRDISQLTAELEIARRAEAIPLSLSKRVLPDSLLKNFALIYAILLDTGYSRYRSYSIVKLAPR